MSEDEKSERDYHGRFQPGHRAIPKRNLHGQFTKNETMVPVDIAPAPQPEPTPLPEVTPLPTIPEPPINNTTSRTVLTETSSTNPVISTFPENEEEIPIREKETILDKHSLIAVQVDRLLLRKKKQ